MFYVLFSFSSTLFFIIYVFFSPNFFWIIVFDPFNSIITSVKNDNISANSVTFTTPSFSKAFNISQSIAEPVNVVMDNVNAAAFNTNGHSKLSSSTSTKTTTHPFDYFDEQFEKLSITGNNKTPITTTTTTITNNNNNNINNIGGFSNGNDTFFANFDDAFKWNHQNDLNDFTQ